VVRCLPSRGVGNGEDIAHYRLWCVVVDIGFAKWSTGSQLYNKTCDFFNTFMKLNEHGT